MRPAIESQVSVELFEIADAGLGALELVHGAADGRVWRALDFPMFDLSRVMWVGNKNKSPTYSCARRVEAASSVI